VELQQRRIHLAAGGTLVNGYAQLLGRLN